MADHETETDDGSTFKVKRKRNENAWAKNVRKRLRREGKPYINESGKGIKARKTGTSCRCKRGCLTKYSDEAKELLITNLNNLTCKDAQDSYLYGLLREKVIDRRRPRKGEKSLQREKQYIYTVVLGEQETVVCREGFASLFGIGVRRVRRLTELHSAGVSPKDNRGCHNNRPRAKLEDIKEMIDAHIRSFPYCVQHYGSRAKQRYLRSDLDVMQMYVLFLEKHYPETYLQVKGGADPKHVKCTVKYEYFLRYYQEHFNYQFGRPRSDLCAFCEEYRVKICAEKNGVVRKQMQQTLKLHKAKARKFRTSMKDASGYVQGNENAQAICFDFQQNIPFPHLQVSDVFYKRQLWLHNFAVTN
ncbi:uncharacterized protein LOC134537892 [Bacillus rossius redtenbacheri]|uniref:uncharacterized protein LOC134537892 n=1 Tax=Bacillus rossius redtenbacheri TaxID=93214 RepID=UPI002FDE5CB5